LKTNFAIATLFSVAAFLTPAHATSVLYSFTSGGVATTSGSDTLGLTFTATGGTTTVSAWGFDGGVIPGVSPTAPVATALDETSKGLGINNPTATQTAVASTDIAYNDFIQVDFSSAAVPAAGNTVAVGLYIDIANVNDHYAIYGITNNGLPTAALASISTDTLLTSSTSTFALNSTGGTTFTFVQPTTAYTGFILAVDCQQRAPGGVVLQTLTITPPSPTPEPGTFVMAGMALIALGVTMRKRGRKA
jgi:hypothetical protein